MNLYLFGSTVLMLFVILDPPGLLPVFLGLTRHMTRKERVEIAGQACLVALVVIALFAVFGRQILDYLHVSIPALQASGGLLLLLVALDLLQGKEQPIEEGSNVAFVPLGIPLLAGPGTIVSIMIAMDHAKGDTGALLTVLAALVVAILLVFVFFFFAVDLYKILRDGGTVLCSRIAGMLLAGIAVQMLADGVFALIKAAGLGG